MDNRVTATDSDTWMQRAREALEEALGELGESDISISQTALALECQRAAYLELTDAELRDLEEYFAVYEVECTCRPDLRDRGGFSSRCPLHGRS